MADKKKIDNKKRNKVILETAVELFEDINREVDDIFVEDLETEDETEQVLVGVTVTEPASLIGYRGKSLASLQQILSLIVKNKLGYWVRVLLDVNEYRSEQEKRLTDIAKNAATRVKETEERAILSPMSSYERRLCHMAVAEIEGVETESEGEGEDRHVVIRLKTA